MRAIITGAAGGIGFAAAEKLRQLAVAKDEKCQLMLVDINAEALSVATSKLAALGAEVESFVGDLSDPLVPQQIVDATKKAFHGIDALISNAGIIGRAFLADLTVEQFDQTFAINTRATWLLAKAAYPLLKESRGAIVATASISGVHPTPPLGMYSPSKAALLMLMRQLSVEWGPDGIRCNCVSPGSTHTNMTDARYSDPVLREEARKKNPLHMVAQAEHQASVIAFLVSQDAAYVNGENIVVDGGLQNMLMPASGMGDPWSR